MFKKQQGVHKKWSSRNSCLWRVPQVNCNFHALYCSVRGLLTSHQKVEKLLVCTSTTLALLTLNLKNLEWHMSGIKKERNGGTVDWPFTLCPLNVM